MTTSRQERLTAYRKKLLDDSFLASNIHVEDSMGYLEDILMNRKPITAEVSRWLKDGDRIALMRNIRYSGEKNITVILNDDTFQLEERIKIIEIYGAVNIESRQKSVTPKWLSNCAHVLKKELIVPESFFKPEEFFDYAMQYPVLLTYQKTVCPNAVLDEHRHGMFMLLHDANVVFSTSDIAKNSIITAIMDSQKKLNVERVCRQYLTEEDIKNVLEQTFFKLLEEHFSIDNLFPLFTEEQKILYWWNTIVEHFGEEPNIQTLHATFPSHLAAWENLNEWEAMRAMGAFNHLCDEKYIFKIFYTRKHDALRSMQDVIRNQKIECDEISIVI